MSCFQGCGIVLAKSLGLWRLSGHCYRDSPKEYHILHVFLITTHDHCNTKNLYCLLIAMLLQYLEKWKSFSSRYTAVLPLTLWFIKQMPWNTNAVESPLSALPKKRKETQKIPAAEYHSGFAFPQPSLETQTFPPRQLSTLAMCHAQQSLGWCTHTDHCADVGGCTSVS